MQDNRGMTALMRAVLGGYTDIARLLVDKESGVQDNEGITALDYAKKIGNQEIIQILLDHETK